MHFWLLVEGEPLPTDFDNSRLHRMCLLADLLHSRGHKITVWSSTTNHRDKVLRSNKKLILNYKNGYDVVLLDSPTYKRNISISRIYHNIQTAKKFKEVVSKKLISPPDIIVSAYPAIELAKAGVEVSISLGVPSIIDVRDLWPDIFVEILPKWLQFLGKIGTFSFERQANFISRNASAIVGITDGFVQWFVNKSNKKNISQNKTFHLSYQVEELDENESKQALSFWKKKGIFKDENIFTICMFGNLAANSEIPLLVNAAKQIERDQKYKIRFVVCGIGEIFDSLKKNSRNLNNFFLPGWVDKKQIRALMQMSDVGILPYRSDRGFQLSYPNKVGEYLSEGLPIISSIKGELSKFLFDENIGLTYENNNEDKLVQAIYSLIEDKNLEKQMRLNAKKVFDKKFDANKVYKDYIDFMEKQIYLHKAYIDS